MSEPAVRVNGIEISKREMDDIKYQVLRECLNSTGWRNVEATAEVVLAFICKKYYLIKKDQMEEV